MAGPKKRSEADDIFDSASADDIFNAAPSPAAVAPPVVQPAPSEPGWFSPESNSGAVLRGLGQGTSLGFSDELSGLVMGGLAGTADSAARLFGAGDVTRDEIRYRLTGELPRDVGGKGVEGSAYDAARDSMRRENAAAKEASPYLYGGSELAGAIAMPVPGAGGVKIGGAVLKPWAGRALVGAGTGAVTAAGMSEADSIGGVARDSGLGAGFGAVAAPVAGAIGDKIGGAFARWLEKRSRQNALKAVGLTPGITNKAKQLNYTNEDDLLSLGAALRDEGDLIKPFSKPDSVAKATEAALEESVSAKSAAISELDEMLAGLGEKFDFNKLAQRADDTLKPPMGWDPLTRETAGKAMTMMGKASAAEGGFGMADQVRRAAGKSINWKAPSFGQALPEEIAMQRRAYGGIADELLSQAKDVEARALLKQGKVPTAEDLGASNQVAAMNKRISTLMDANALADEAATRELAKGSVGVTDLMKGGMVGGALTPALGPIAGPAAGMVATGISSALKPRMPSLMTYPQHAAAKALPQMTRAAEPYAIKALTNETSPIAVKNAYDALLERFGINAKSKEELADEAFLKGQSDPGMQSGR